MGTSDLVKSWIPSSKRGIRCSLSSAQPFLQYLRKTSDVATGASSNVPVSRLVINNSIALIDPLISRDWRADYEHWKLALGHHFRGYGAKDGLGESGASVRAHADQIGAKSRGGLADGS